MSIPVLIALLALSAVLALVGARMQLLENRRHDRERGRRMARGVPAETAETMARTTATIARRRPPADTGRISATDRAALTLAAWVREDGPQSVTAVADRFGSSVAGAAAIARALTQGMEITYLGVTADGLMVGAPGQQIVRRLV